MNDDEIGKMLDDLFILSTLLKSLFKYKNIDGYSKIPFSYYQVLLTLKNVGTLPISETGNLVCIKKQNMTYMTDKLVEKGLIKRMPDMNDRRVINITITNIGRECLSKWQKYKIKTMKRNLSVSDDEELEKLYNSIEYIKNVLSKMEDD